MTDLVVPYPEDDCDPGHDARVRDMAPPASPPTITPADRARLDRITARARWARREETGR